MGDYPTSGFNHLAVLSEPAPLSEFNRASRWINHPDIGIVVFVVAAGHLLEKPSRIRILSRRLRPADFVSAVFAGCGVVNGESGFTTEEEVPSKSNVFHIVPPYYQTF